MESKELFLILDTNTYLHYLTFTDVDWCKLFSCKRICLLIPLVVLDELDRIKNEHKLGHIRKRAQTISSLLDKYMDDLSLKIRNGVRLEFLDELNEIDDLKVTYNDNKLILAVKELINQGNINVIIVTHDAGLVRRAKIRGIDTRKLPEDYKIDFTDESDKKTRELEQKYLRLEKTFPKLTVKFENDSERIERIIQPPAIFPDFFDYISFNSIKQEYDKKIEACQNALSDKNSTEISKSGKLPSRVKRKNRNPEINQQLEKINTQLSEVPAIELNRFIIEANQFLQQYWQYFELKKQWQNYWNLVLELKLIINNEGLVPAQDIEINIELPENLPIFFLSPNQFPAQPLAPNPPIEPRINGVVIGETIIEIGRWLFGKNNLPVNQLNPVAKTPVKEENISKVIQNSKKVQISIKKVKHTHNILLPSLYVYYNNYNSAQSFHFNFKALADNTPDPVCGQLHIIINKPLISLPWNLLGN